ncbi:hypothetical protein AB0F43_09930 [Kribbella sp. NPDC023972]|uniref:hypothetical protein n=1 Tax=Kribbella sp. NPDC023972 TaxID=3154795 RepID=UPI0033D93AD1
MTRMAACPTIAWTLRDGTVSRRSTRPIMIKPPGLRCMLTGAYCAITITGGQELPTHEWTMANDGYGPPRRPWRKAQMVIAFGVLACLGVAAVRYVIGAQGGDAPVLDTKSYKTSVDCQVNTVGSQGTVTISGTISGDSRSYSVTVEVLDGASQQRIGGQTFEVRDTTTFGGTTPAEAPIGPAGIECKITKVA